MLQQPSHCINLAIRSNFWCNILHILSLVGLTHRMYSQNILPLHLNKTLVFLISKSSTSIHTSEEKGDDKSSNYCTKQKVPDQEHSHYSTPQCPPVFPTKNEITFFEWFTSLETGLSIKKYVLFMCNTLFVRLILWLRVKKWNYKI